MYIEQSFTKKAKALSLSLSLSLSRRVARRRHQQLKPQPGFTIVELLIVIVVIAILAAITIVAYNGIQQKATAASLTSDLDNASKLLKLYQVDNSGYPLTNDCSASPAANSICLKSSSGTTYTAFQTSNASNPQTFCLTALNKGVNYRITSDGTPESGTCSGVLAGGTSCPTGYIVVPGSFTYGTSEFCVMKYEAKNVGSVATSQASGSPWVSISQTTSLTTATAACSGCHLITEAEWMTLAQNVLSVASNWSSGTVGTGYIYSGHNDNGPANALDADSNDANGYSGTGQSSPSNQRRTLTLTNGEVIWDLAGNVWEWTSGTSTTGQPGITGEAGYAWKEWTSVTNNGSNPVNPSPAGTNLLNANTWNSSKGVGQLYSFAGETAVRGFLRGGAWGNGGYAGVLTLNLGSAPSSAGTNVGFRVSR
jgi:prepilin-type N-terminal cleavage/methylation domain-containing protein